MNKFFRMYNHHGIKRTLHWIFYRGINYLIYYRCYCFYYAETPPNPPEKRDDVEYRFVDQAEFERVRTKENYSIKLERVRELYRGGFVASGVYYKNKLVSYVWINTRWNYVHTDFSVQLKLSPGDWLYLIKAYTIKEARGKNFATMLREWLLCERGASGMVFDVEAVNYPSINTIMKNGSKPICNLRVLGIGKFRLRFGGKKNRFFTVL